MDCVPTMTFQAPATAAPAAPGASAEGGFAALLAGLKGTAEPTEEHATPRPAQEPSAAAIPSLPDPLAAVSAPAAAACATAAAAALAPPGHTGTPPGLDSTPAQQDPMKAPPVAAAAEAIADPASPIAAGPVPGATPMPDGGAAAQPVPQPAAIAGPAPTEAARPIADAEAAAPRQRPISDAHMAPAVALTQTPVRGAEAEAASRSAVATARDATPGDGAARNGAIAARPPERLTDAPEAATTPVPEGVSPSLERPATASPERSAALAPSSPQPAAVLAPHPAQAELPAAAPASSAPPPPPVRQLAPVVVAVAIAGGTARLAVTLEPAELGRVEISIEQGGATAEIRVLAERPETLALLQRDQRELDRALGQAGIGPEERRLSFALAERGPGDPGSGQPGDRRGEGPRAPRMAALADAPPAAAAPVRRPLSLIDLAI